MEVRLSMEVISICGHKTNMVDDELETDSRNEKNCCKNKNKTDVGKTKVAEEKRLVAAK